MKYFLLVCREEREQTDNDSYKASPSDVSKQQQLDLHHLNLRPAELFHLDVEIFSLSSVLKYFQC